MFVRVPMFVLVSVGGLVYTGRTGEGWLSADREDAFAYGSRTEADRRAAFFNSYSSIHGCTFSVEDAAGVR